MAEIVLFPKLPRRRAAMGALDMSDLRRSIAELDRARARRDRHGANLAQQSAALAAVGRDLQSHVAHARELEALADSIHNAVAAGDMTTLGRLETRVRWLMARQSNTATLHAIAE